MNRIILLTFVIAAVLGFLINQLMSHRQASLAGNPMPAQFLPWQIEKLNNGNTRVFGLELGRSSLADVEKLFREKAEVSLFVSKSGHYELEAYFDKVILGGFSAQYVLTIALTQEQLADLYKRGSRLSHLSDGRQKVSLAAQDTPLVYQAQISSLVYLTRTWLDGETLLKRFGEPWRKIRESNRDAVHWLYPEKGLDVAIDDSGRAVFQYIAPKRFDLLLAPLTNNVR